MVHYVGLSPCYYIYVSWDTVLMDISNATQITEYVAHPFDRSCTSLSL